MCHFLVQRGQKCEQSNNFWENYEEDIARVVSLNATVFRLSLGALSCTALRVEAELSASPGEVILQTEASR